MADDIVTIDGSVVRGGGQVLRNAASYAAILGKSVQFVNIRASRRRSGLRPQYIEGLQVVAKLSKSTLQNAHEGSRTVSFTPNENLALHNSSLAASSSPSLFSDSAAPSVVADWGPTSVYEIHTKDAATSLLVQALLPVLLFSPNETKLVISGGAGIVVSPAIDYMKLVLVPVLHKQFGVTGLGFDIVRRDCMPRGAALVTTTTSPIASLPPITLRERGDVVRVSCFLYGYGKANEKFLEAGETAFYAAVRQNGIDVDVRFSTDVSESDDQTNEAFVCGVLVYAETSTGCILGGSSTVATSEAKEVVSSAVEDLVKQLQHGGCADEYLQDQLVIFMALADGVSEIVTGPVTEHTECAIEVAHRMTGAKFSVSKVEEGSDRVAIRCEGIGHQSRAKQPTPNESPFLSCSRHPLMQDFRDMFHPMNAA